jgi:hypothetical protein
MWSLWIISVVLGSSEFKLTQYETYNTSMECAVEEALLESYFTESEIAFCILSD